MGAEQGLRIITIVPLEIINISMPRGKLLANFFKCIVDMNRLIEKSHEITRHCFLPVMTACIPIPVQCCVTVLVTRRLRPDFVQIERASVQIERDYVQIESGRFIWHATVKSPCQL